MGDCEKAEGHHFGTASICCKTIVDSKPGTKSAGARPRKASNQMQPIDDLCPRILSVDEQGKSMPLTPEKSIQFTRKAPAQDLPTLAKPPWEDLRMEAENPDKVGTLKICERFGVSDTSKTIQRHRPLHCSSGFTDGGMLLNHKLRASNLEINLKRAGGLSRWLASLGVDQFVTIFQRKSVNKFQLVNLTMKKLKDMGANSVGPRRKLVHAIDCVCRSYCFEAI